MYVLYGDPREEIQERGDQLINVERKLSTNEAVLLRWINGSATKIPNTEYFRWSTHFA
jgi:hypothetical protein